jgi:hypothetical protein
MAVKYEKVVVEDLELGIGEVLRSMPGGGSAVGNKIGSHSLPAMAFTATLASPQAIPVGSTPVVIQAGSEAFDTADWYNPTTYTFAPTIPGYYQLSAGATLASFSGIAILAFTDALGSQFFASVDAQRSAAAATLALSTLVYMNGTTDAVRLTIYHSDSVQRNITAARFSGIALGS